MAYNAIYGQPLLNAVGAIRYTYHQVMKFPTSRGVGCVREDQQASRKCYVDSISVKGTPPIMMLEVEPPKGRIKPLDMIERISISKGWSLALGTHRLGVLPGAKPVKQKKMNLTSERQKVAKTEVKKLLLVGFIREVQYPEWLAKIVLVKKSNGKWRMCVDYIGLNKACPKDSYPLSRIDHLVDATSGHERFSFLDAFSGIEVNPDKIQVILEMKSPLVKRGSAADRARGGPYSLYESGGG
ncbi:uncharacterized protein LOC111406594 [Olea europaea var. sylvestris]|uniref:uncharacterized protein LOC111406594 n=1 Tax=Olea europaea var. sylvestris TaxID=158386 RepID=UPI000C1D6DD1|nr:uncharacterized protein LOC111406594 [Olea europaea var. sylvestris]